MNAANRAILMVALLAAGCGAPDGAPNTDGTWVGTITTEGNVTTVVNESGSVWGGTARLVEEASIGVEAGAEPYLLGMVLGVGVAEDLIYVLDRQVHRIRVYDRNGIHVRDLGREGDGPGEFRSPAALAVGQRIYVRDSQVGRITLFDTTGELVDTWPIMPHFSSMPMVATTAGELYVPYEDGMTPWGPEGQAGDPIPYREDQLRPPRVRAVRADGAEFGHDVPFWPMPVFAMSPSGAVFRGAGDAYRFTVQRQDGRELRVERRVAPAMLADAEAAWHRAQVGEYVRQADPGWEWEGPEIPAVKPAFGAFVPALSGEVWVQRAGAGYEDTDCEPYAYGLEAPETCWKDTRIVDAFAADGRYLGAVDVPDGLRLFETWGRIWPWPYIHDEMVVGVVEDQAGTIMVKRYRLVLPGER